MNGIEIIQAEYDRHPEHGWTPEHDDGHNEGEMAVAAACYAVVDVLPDGQPVYVGRLQGACDICEIEDAWPWDPEWDKRAKHDRIKQLAIAGSLIAREIERLQRLKNGPDGPQEAPQTTQTASPGSDIPV